MKAAAFILALSLPALAEEADSDIAAKIAEHQEGAAKLSEVQDELSADVQQLIIEQTNLKLIEMLEAVEEAMDEASLLLLDHDTGGTTIAAETEVIELIFAAAKERQQQSGGGQTGDAMLEMMRQMMGQGEQPGPPGQQPGDQAGDTGGQGKTGDSDTANTDNTGDPDAKVEERRVPKASGKAGQGLPREFQDALDAYNRAAEKLAK